MIPYLRVNKWPDPRLKGDHLIYVAQLDRALVVIPRVAGSIPVIIDAIAIRANGKVSRNGNCGSTPLFQSLAIKGESLNSQDCKVKRRKRVKFFN